MADGGISGLAVAFAAGGGLLIYAGLKGLSPVAALKDVSGGHPSGLTGTGIDLAGQARTPVAPVIGSAVLGAQRTAAVNAAQHYKNDKYSQARRTQPGYSDCSSFCDKAFADAQIPTPGSRWASTANYRMSPYWKKIPAASSIPGDVAISAGHMVLVTGAGGTAAIGQQNPRVNVREGTVAQLMGKQTYWYLRYTPGG